MTALSELADALRDNTTLAWCVKYAPDGNADAAVKHAWDAEPRGGPVLVIAVKWCTPPCEAALDYALAVALGKRPPADELRRYIPCPTFAQLTRGGKV